MGQFIFAGAVAIALLHFQLPECLVRPPERLLWPFADWINFEFVFEKDDLGYFRYLCLRICRRVVLGRNRKSAVRSQRAAADRSIALNDRRRNYGGNRLYLQWMAVVIAMRRILRVGRARGPAWRGLWRHSRSS